jgi:hypothetical protein
VTARWKSPNATLSGLDGCAAVPSDFMENGARDLLDKALANAFRGGVDGKQIADAVALDAPVDLVVALEDRHISALYAFSVGLTSLDRVKTALSAAGPLEEVQPNYWRVGVKTAGTLTCVVGPAAGAAPARLICGRRDKDVAALGPYLARTAPVAPPPARDLHAEIRFSPVDERFGGQIRSFLGTLPALARLQASIGEPRFDGALTDAATALAGEGAALVSDLDRLTLDVGVDATSCMTGSLAIDMRGKKSFIASLIAERSSTAGPPPAIFWRAPKDSDAATYGRPTDPSRYDSIYRTLRALVEGGLAKEKVGTEADRKALAGLLAAPLSKDTNVVIASGHWSAPPPASPAGAAGPGAIVNNAMGWYLFGFDEGPASLTKLFKNAVAVYGRKALNDELRKVAGDKARLLPSVKLVPAPAALGRGALDVELRFEVPAGDAAAKNAKKPPAQVLHGLLMGETQSTWIGIGANRDELVSRMLAAKAGAPEGGTLATRDGLEPLRSGKAVSSGFVTLGSITRGITSGLASGAGNRANVTELINTLNNLPHKGETPIFLTTTSASDGPRSELSVNMEKGSFEDVGAVLLTIQRIANALRP